MFPRRSAGASSLDGASPLLDMQTPSRSWQFTPSPASEALASYLPAGLPSTPSTPSTASYLSLTGQLADPAYTAPTLLVGTSADIPAAAADPCDVPSSNYAPTNVRDAPAVGPAAHALAKRSLEAVVNSVPAPLATGILVPATSPVRQPQGGMPQYYQGGINQPAASGSSARQDAHGADDATFLSSAAPFLSLDPPDPSKDSDLPVNSTSPLPLLSLDLSAIVGPRSAPLAPPLLGPPLGDAKVDSPLTPLDSLTLDFDPADAPAQLLPAPWFPPPKDDLDETVLPPPGILGMRQAGDCPVQLALPTTVPSPSGTTEDSDLRMGGMGKVTTPRQSPSGGTGPYLWGLNGAGCHQGALHALASQAASSSTAGSGDLRAVSRLFSRPVYHMQVTTAKTKAASALRRRAAAPFRCPVPGCESSFTRALNLRGHLRSHTDERPYQCAHCDRSFARAHDKRRHEKLHFVRRDQRPQHLIAPAHSLPASPSRHGSGSDTSSTPTSTGTGRCREPTTLQAAQTTLALLNRNHTQPSAHTCRAAPGPGLAPAPNAHVYLTPWSLPTPVVATSTTALGSDTPRRELAGHGHGQGAAESLLAAGLPVGPAALTLHDAQPQLPPQIRTQSQVLDWRAAGHIL